MIVKTPRGWSQNRGHLIWSLSRGHLVAASSITRRYRPTRRGRASTRRGTALAPNPKGSAAMSRKRTLALWGTGLAVAAITACGAPAASISTAPGNSPPSTTPAAIQLTGTCNLGWLAGYEGSPQTFYAGGGFYPDTAAGERAAGMVPDTPGYPADGYLSEDTGFRFTTANDSAAGISVSGIMITVTYQGTEIGTYDVPVSPRFLAPGEQINQTVRFADLPGAVAVSDSTYLGSVCAVTGTA